MVCETCGKEFFEDWRKPQKNKLPPARFCSRTCAATRKWNNDQKLAMRNNLERARTFISLENLNSPEQREHSKVRLQQLWKTDKEEMIRRTGGAHENFRKAGLRASQAATITARDKIQEYWASGGYGSLVKAHISKRVFRKYILDLLGHKCQKCGCEELWQNEPLSLHVDHIDGDALNNKLENLRVLCPNCHSQTETFGSKNRGKSTREFLVVPRN